MSLLRVFTILFLTLAVAGCTVDRKDPVRKHSAPPVTQKDKKTGETASTLGNLDLKKIHSDAQSKNVNLVQEIIRPLSNEVLKAENLREAKFTGSNEALWALQLLNISLVEANKKSSSDVHMQSYLAKYKETLLMGCGARSLRNCQNFHFFRKDAYSVDVIKILLAKASDVREYYRLMYVAFELTNRRPDEELSALGLNRTLDYLRVFIQESQGERGELVLSVRQLSEEDQSNYSFALNFLALVAKTSTKEAKLRGFKNSISDVVRWMASPNFSNVLGSSLAAEINTLTAEWIKSPEVWKKIVNGMEIWERQDESYSNNIKSISSDVLKRYDVKTVDLSERGNKDPRSLLRFYFLSRIFGLQALSQELYLWNMSDQDLSGTVDDIATLLQTDMLAKTYRSHAIMSAAFKTIVAKGNSKKDLLSETIRYARGGLTPIWTSFHSRANRLQSFFEGYVEKNAGSNVELNEKIKRLRGIFNQLNMNILSMVTYPNMMMFGYFAAKNDYSETISIPGGSITIDKTLFVNDLFQGDVPPLFILTNYSGRDSDRNYEKLNEVEIMRAFHHMMQANLIDLYGFKLNEFLEVVFKTLKEPYDEKIRTWLKKLQDMNQPSAEFPTFASYCKALDGSGSFELSVTPRSIYDLTFLGSLGGSTMLEPLRSIYPYFSLSVREANRGLDEAIETLRSDVGPRLRWLHLVKAIFEKMPSTSSREEALKVLELQLRESVELKQKATEMISQFSSIAEECLPKFSEAEFSRQAQMAKMEMRFAEDVYLSLEILGELQQQSELPLVQLKAQNPNHRLFTDARFKDFNTTLSVRRALNQWLADRSGLAEFFSKNPAYKEELMFSGGLQRDAQGRYVYLHRGRDFTARALSFLKYGYDNVFLNPKPDRTEVLWPVSHLTIKDLNNPYGPGDTAIAIGKGASTSRENDLLAFKKSFLQLILLRTQWLDSERGTTSVFRDILKLKAAVYKYRFQSEVDVQQIANCDATCEQKMSEEMKLGAEKFIELSNSMLARFTLTPEKTELLSMMDTNSFFNVDGTTSFQLGPINLFFSSDATDIYAGLIDESFMFVSSQRLGYKPEFWGLRSSESTYKFVESGASDTNRKRKEDVIGRPYPFYEAEKFVPALSEVERNYLFPIDENVEKVIRARISYQTKTDMLLAHSFEAATQDWTASGKLRNPMQFSTNRERLEQANLLTETFWNSYLLLMRGFNTRTKGHFAPEILKKDPKWMTN